MKKNSLFFSSFLCQLKYIYIYISSVLLWFGCVSPSLPDGTCERRLLACLCRLSAAVCARCAALCRLSLSASVKFAALLLAERGGGGGEGRSQEDRGSRGRSGIG